jgi:hypothetical protein
MNTTLIQVTNPRSAFHGSWRFGLVVDGRTVWMSNPGSKEWAARNAAALWPGLELR